MIDPEIRSYVLAFRILELKSVLNQLSLPITGRKTDLQRRIFHYFGVPFAGLPPTVYEPPKEEWKLQAAKRIISDVFASWKGQRAGTQTEIGPPAATSATTRAGTAQNGVPTEPNNTISGIPSPQRVQSVETITAGENMRGTGSPQFGKRTPVNGKLAAAPPMHSPRSAGGIIRCICENNIDRGTMIQCEAEGCGIWQHCSCIGIIGEPPEHFYCELCRAAWADPFWELLNPKVMSVTRLVPSGGPMVRGANGMQEIEQVAERTFQLTHGQMGLLNKRGDLYQLQAVSMLLDDPVSFRYQWPRNAELKVNQMGYRVYSRQANSKVGNNTRDEPANLATTVFAGLNRVRLKVNDNRKFVLMVHLAKKREIDEVKSLMAPSETVSVALQRVRQQVGKADDDITIGSTIMSLRDPLSGARVTNPARFKGTSGLVAFDLDTFLGMTKRTRKWQCPHSMRHARVQELQLDTYVARIIDSLAEFPDVLEIEVSPDGEWRPSTGRYPWTQITDPLPAPLPEPVMVKPEPGRPNDTELDSDEEELSEAEELRRAAAAYAKVAKRPTPEIIVLDDSSEDESTKQAKKRHVSASSSQISIPVAPQRNRFRPLHQQTLASNIRSYHLANGTSNSSAAAAQDGQTGSGTSATSSGRMQSSYGGANGTATGTSQGLNIRFHPRLSNSSAAVQSSRLTIPQPSLNAHGQMTSTRYPANDGPTSAANGTNYRAPAGSGHWNSAPYESGRAQHSSRHDSWDVNASTQQGANSAAPLPPVSYSWQSNPPPAQEHPRRQGATLISAPGITRYAQGRSSFQPPLPPAPPPPPPDDDPATRRMYANGRELDSSDRAMLNVFLDGGSRGYNAHISSPNVVHQATQSLQPSSSAIIDLDSD